MAKFYSRDEVVELVRSWIGKKESDGSYKSILDTYNAHEPLPRGYKIKYTDAWCACTWSAVVIKLGYEEIMPIEVSCAKLITLAKEMGIWTENDGYVPKPGDGVLYDWDDSGKGDNSGNPDHIGIVDYVNQDSGYFTVIEGNYSDSVKKRTVSINGKFIRGFICPRYDTSVSFLDNSSTVTDTNDIKSVAMEVISGLWGNGPARKSNLEAHGFNYAAVQKMVNQILNTPSGATSSTCKYSKSDESIKGYYLTTANLNLRNDAGTNKKILTTIPRSSEVFCDGGYTMSNGIKWYHVEATVKGKHYDGFCCSKYLNLF